MCLAIPAKVISVEGPTARVTIEDVEYTASLLLLNDVHPGDFIMLHAGFAIEKVDPLEAAESLQLFSGFRGTGKPTELFRLRQQLKGSGCLVLYANALDYFSPSAEIDISTMLMAVAGAFGEQLENSGAGTVAETFWQRIKVEAGAPAPAKALLGELKAGLDMKVALKTAPSFRQKLREFLADRLGELKREVNAFVEECVKSVRAARKQPDLRIVFLFERREDIGGVALLQGAAVHADV